MLLAAIETTLSAHGVRRRGDDVVVVACSGGVDSVVLMHGAVTLLGARRVVAVHVDHGVRPGSAADAAWVETFAGSLGATARVERVHPASDAEAELRDKRYAALELARAAIGATLVLTAHTEDDQAEQVLIALIRSAHPDSLAGIPIRRGTILRPMLGVPRRAVVRYAERHRLTWREDPTNNEPRYLRNRVRKELLPLIERRYRAGAAHRLAQLARRVSERSKSADDRDIDATPLVPSPVPLDHCPIAFSRRRWSGGPIPDGRNKTLFDAASIGAFTVRGLRDGDRIRPYGHSGRRKIRDVLREAGIGVVLRPRVWVVEANNEVVWVPGLLRANCAPVQETTTDVWVFWTAPTPELQGGELRATLPDGQPAGGGSMDREDGP